MYECESCGTLTNVSIPCRESGDRLCGECFDKTFEEPVVPYVKVCIVNSKVSVSKNYLIEKIERIGDLP